MTSWKDSCVSPEKVLDRITPGTSIFLGTGPAEPRTLVKHLMASEAYNLQDLELIQLVSLGEATSVDQILAHKFRLKTFFSGGTASAAITEGRVDLIPSRFSKVPELMERGMIPVQAAFIQVSAPNESGFCSFGTAVDVARLAMEQASFNVAEVNEATPRTFGDTFVHLSEFDLVIEGTEPPFTFDRWPVDTVFDLVAANVATQIEDGACIHFSIGSLFEALSKHLTSRRHLGVHSPFFTDALRELVESGAVTNRRKTVFRGKSLACYALGTRSLLDWLDNNPLVEFQALDKVISPLSIGQNPNVFCLLQARKVDLSGAIAMHFGKTNVAAGPGEAIDYINGAELSQGGRVCFALPSRNRHGESNIKLSVRDLPNEFALREAIDMIVTEQGVAYVKGRSLRERAQVLIEVAHPDDRPQLVEEAKAAKILYKDQIFLPASANFYPSNIAIKETFKGHLEVRFRPIKPSDEEEMRHLFYRFSDKAVYYRYFTPIKAMPHRKMQQYVNVDYRESLSIVGLVDEPGVGHIIAEGRFVKHKNRPMADIAFVVDEAYNGRGIATYLFKLLVQYAKERGLKGFTADVLATNKAMMRVIEKTGLSVHARLEEGAYAVTVNFDETANGSPKER